MGVRVILHGANGPPIISSVPWEQRHLVSPPRQPAERWKSGQVAAPHARRNQGV